MSFLYNNTVAIAVAAVASLMVWLFGGVRSEWLFHAAPWALAFLIEIMLCYPQRRYGETTYDARNRAWREMKRSPIVWVAVGFLTLTVIPFINNGLCPSCDRQLLAQGISAEPLVPFLPFCVNRLEHLDVWLWFAVAFASVVATYHCTTKSGKRLILEMIVWNGAALAVFGFVQAAMGAPGPFWTVQPDGKPDPDFFATFCYPNMASDYFTLLFGISIALWRQQYESIRKEETSSDNVEGAAMTRRYGRFWRRHYFLLPAIVFFFATLNTLCRASIMLITALSAIFFLHTLVVFLSRMKKSRRVIVGVWSMVVFGSLVFFSAISLPEKIAREMRSVETFSVLDRVTGKGQYHSDVAMALWRDHKLFGCGGWGYKHFCCPKMKELKIDLRNLQGVGGINVHNDYLQFLTEHGFVGFGAMVAMVVLLVFPVARQWRATLHDLRFKKDKDLPPKPLVLFAVPSPVVILYLTLLASLIHSFGDCALRSAAVLTLFYVTFAAVPGFMPRDNHDYRSKH